MAWIDRLLCRLGRCRRCRVYEDEHGIGGKCTTCGRVHGWMTSAELREVLGRSPVWRIPLIDAARDINAPQLPLARLWIVAKRKRGAA